MLFREFLFFLRSAICILFSLQAMSLSAWSGEGKLGYDYFFIEAMRQQTAGHYDAAFDLLQHCLALNPNAAEVYYHQALYLSSMDKDSLALAYLEKAAALNPHNDTYLERVAQFYLGVRDYDKAIKAYERLVHHYPDRLDDLNILAKLYQNKKDYPNMLRSIERIEIAEGSSEQITLAKMRVYELMKDKKSAYKMLRKLVKDHPYDLMYKTMLGNWLMQNGKRKDAYKVFVSVLREEPDDSYAQSSLYDYYRETGQKTLAMNLLEKMLQSRKVETSTKVQLIRQVIADNEEQGGDSTEVLDVFDRVLAQPQYSSDIAQLKAAYMDLKQMPQDSVNNALRKVLEIAPDEASARIHLVQNYWGKKDFDEVIRLCGPALEYNPDEMAFYYFMGLAHFQKKDNDEALDVFRRGVGQIHEDSNKELASDFYAIMGDILHEKGFADEAFSAYDSCLQYKDDHIMCLNNYAYYLSVEKRQLQKAEQMSYRTIKAEPNNPTYLDTYAWILFEEKRYAEAKIYIDQALQNDTDSLASAVIVEHAGDIYAMNGDMDRAIDYWKRAEEMGDETSKILARKIKLRKYIEDEE